MTRATQKDEEIFYTGEFLRDQLALNLAELKSAIQEPPDCSATAINTDGTSTLLNFEIAEYYVDHPEEGGGSTMKRVSSCWDKVTAILNPQLEKLRLPVDVNIRFNEPVSLRNGQVIGLANELIRFAREFCPGKHLERATHEVFSSEAYPLLRELVERIVLTHLEGTVVIGWYCSNIAAANIGVDRLCLADLVRRKSAKNFTWAAGAEKCLLVYASGATVTSGAGPFPPDQSIWLDEGLVAACKESVFDRIYFWERVRAWHKRLK